jgi:hypothetical protein
MEDDIDDLIDDVGDTLAFNRELGTLLEMVEYRLIAIKKRLEEKAPAVRKRQKNEFVSLADIIARVNLMKSKYDPE